MDIFGSILMMMRNYISDRLLYFRYITFNKFIRLVITDY